MEKILNKNFPDDNYPPVIIHLIFMLAAITFCFIYHHKIVAPADFYNDEYGAILKVLNLEAIRSIQYRILVPVIFKVLSLGHLIPDKTVFFLITLGNTYLLIIVFFRLISVYFSNRQFNYIAAMFIIYPMIWNFISLNSIFFFVDTALLLLMTICLYLVITQKNNWLLLFFFLGAANHYSIGFIIPAFLLFNYRSVFKFKTILYTALLVVILVGYFTVMRLLLPNQPVHRDDGFVAWIPSAALQVLIDYRKHLLVRDLILNMGGLHILALLFLVSGIWKNIKRQFVYIYLVIIPFYLFAFMRFGIRVEEMRNYIPLIPFVIVPALIFLSRYMNGLLKLTQEISGKK